MYLNMLSVTSSSFNDSQWSPTNVAANSRARALSISIAFIFQCLLLQSQNNIKLNRSFHINCYRLYAGRVYDENASVSKHHLISIVFTYSYMNVIREAINNY